MNETLVQGGFESIKTNLTQMGFTFENDVFTKVSHQVRTMVINGQEHHQKIEHKVEFKYLGEGWVEDSTGQTTTYGLALVEDEETRVDFWVRDWNDLRSQL